MQDMQEMWVQLLGREDPLEQEMATHSSILLGKSHGQRSLVGYSPWGHKESDMTEETGHTHFACTQGLTTIHKKCELFAVFSPRILPLALPRGMALKPDPEPFLGQPNINP